MEYKEKLDDYTEVRRCFYKGEYYQVRDNGAILREAKNPSKPRKWDEIWTFGTKNEETGYMYFSSSVRVHIVVAYAFLGEKDSKEFVVDHKDTNRCNNRVDNLRWLTRLDNVLNNPITRAKVEHLCGGDIQKFIDNPRCLQENKSKQDVAWMRPVSKEESDMTKENFEKLRENPKSSESEKSEKGRIGEWIFQKHNQQNNKYIAQEIISNSNEIILDSLTPFARQKNWKTLTEFPLTPKKENSTIEDYFNNLEKGAVIIENRYGQRHIVDFALHNGVLLIKTFAEQDVKQHGFLTITLDNDGFFVHDGKMFFSEIAASREMVLAQGKEWTGGNCVDDYC